MVYVESLHWDEKAEEHVARHGITIDEVEEAVANHRYARRSRGYVVVLGQTDSGRYLTVVLDDEGDSIWYPVTARPMNDSERRLLQKQTRARKGR